MLRSSYIIASLCCGVFFHEVSAQQQAPSSGLYFTLSGAVYLPGNVVRITDIGVFSSTTVPGTSLVCVTSNVNTECCRYSDGGNVGNWYFPDGSEVVRNHWAPSSDFTRSGFTHQVRLNRRNNAMSPTGSYECRVPDRNGVMHIARIILLLTADAVFLPTTNLTVAEDAGSVRVCAMKNNTHTSAVHVTLTTTDGTATAGSDYVATSEDLIIPVGSTMACMRVTITEDNTLEGDETFTVTLTSLAPLGNALTRIVVKNDGRRIKLDGNYVPSHELLSLSNFPLGSSIPCLAIGQCCSLNPYLTIDAQLGISPSGMGSWRYPNGSYVRLALASDSYGISRQPGQVNLHRQSSRTAEGVWRCEVPGAGGVTDTAYIGIYIPGNGVMTISTDVFLRVVSLQPLKFALVCVTTGGPATRVTWRKNGYDISTRIGVKKQNITNYEEATYINEIVISTYIIAGRYNFHSSNAATNHVSAVLDVSGVRLLLHNGSTVFNNSAIGFEALPTGTALLCSTDRKSIGSSALWRGPTGVQTTTIFNVYSGASVLQVDRTTRPLQAQHNGVWHCEIPDKLNTTQYLYVGLYSQGRGVLTASEEVEFSLTSENPPVFTLTCTTTGGPATTVEWTRNGVRLNNRRGYTMTQIIVDTQQSTYENHLTVSGRQLGVYRVTVSNSRTPSPVLSQYTVTEASPPLDFALTLISDDGVRVTWTPAPSADNSVVYIIYYNNGNVSGQVSVSALARHHILRELAFGDTYSISMAARTDFESRIGPKRILIGIPDVPESIRAVSRVTSIQLNWSTPLEYHGPITRYQVSYRCADSAATSVVITGTTWTLTGLRPETSCTMRVRANTGAGAGDYSNTVTVATTPLPVVVGVLVEEVMDASSIRLAWEPVVLQDWQVDHYTIYYIAFSTSTSKTVHQQTVHTPSTKTSEVFYLTHLDPKFEHRFQVTVSIEVEGEEFESLKYTPLIFNFDASHFQLHLSPVDNCASWEDSKASSLEHSILLALTEAVSELCNCSFSAKFLRTGEFRCWNSPSEVTYRSTLVGIATYNSSQIVGYIESWVRSKTAVVRVGRISLQVLSGDCAVSVSSLSEGECERSRIQEGTSTLSLVSQDLATIKCVQSCLVQNGTSTCGN